MNPHDIYIKQQVELAITIHKLIQFDYVKQDLEVTKDRLVEPMQIIKKKDGTITGFSGFDLTKKAPRGFHFNGVQNIKLINYDKAY